MKYIKSFLESFDGVYLPYQKMGLGMYMSDSEELPKYLVDDVLKKLFPEPKFKIEIEYPLHYGPVVIIYNEDIKNNEFYRMLIDAYQDEWFVVNIQYCHIIEDYYKCDQIDGLIALLSNKEITGVEL